MHSSKFTYVSSAERMHVPGYHWSRISHWDESKLGTSRRRIASIRDPNRISVGNRLQQVFKAITSSLSYINAGKS